MKRILAYCMILMLAALPVFALATTAESPIILGGKGDESCFDTLSLSNGNVILSLTSTGGLDGGPEYGGNTRKVWLLCLAPDGSTVWENNFGADRKGGYTTMLNLILNDDNTFTGTVQYTLSKHPQYWQNMTFSCADGSLVSEGERVIDTTKSDESYRRYYTNGAFTIVFESYNVDDGDRKLLRMTDAKNGELWALDPGTIGLNYLIGWIPTRQGSLLYGKSRVNGVPGPKAIAILVDPDGKVVWSRQTAGDYDSSFFDAIVDSDGRFVALGFARGEMTNNTNEYSLGFDQFSQLVVCWDAATGNEIWQKRTELVDRMLPYSHLAEIDGQYILSDCDINYNGCVFETLDRDGNELQYWTTSFPGYRHFSPRFFAWNGELWTETPIEGGSQDVALERVVIPDDR